MRTKIHPHSARPPRWLPAGLAVALALSAASRLPVGAATRTWDGSSSGNWSAGQNWTGGVAPTNGDDLVFPAGAANLANTNNNLLARVRSITISGAGYVLRGSGATTAITLTNGLNATYAAGSSTVELDLALGAAQEFQCTTAGATLSVSGDVNLGSFTLTADGSGTVSLAGVLSGSGDLTKNGSGTLWLQGPSANTYSGVTRVNTGTLMLAKAGGNSVPNGELIIGDGAGSDLVQERADYQIGPIPITINSSGWLFLDDYDDTVGAITFNGGAASSDSGTLTLGGNVTVNASASVATLAGQIGLSAIRTFDVANGAASPDLDITASISGSGGLTKTGAGLLRLLGANSYSGATTINEGNVYVAHDSAFGATANGTTVTGSGSIQLISANVGVESLTLNKPATVGSVLTASGASSWAGNVILNTNVSISTGGTLEFSGVISGPGGLTLAGAGTYTFSGTNANTYAGDTFVNTGILLLDKAVTDGALPGPGDLFIGDDVGGAQADVVRELRSLQIDGSVDITVNSSGWLDLNDHSDAVGGLTLTAGYVDTGTGTLTLGGNVAATSIYDHSSVMSGKLALGASIRTFDITVGPVFPQLNILAEISGAGGILKSGSGQMALQGSNSYSGLTTVAAGTLHLWDAGTPGNTAAGTVVEDGAAIQMLGAQVGAESLTLQGIGPAGNGALRADWWDNQSNSWAGPIMLAADTLIRVDRTNVLNLAGAITGSGGFTKIGSDRLMLSGSTGNTYAGDTIVEQGTLELGKTAGAGVAIRYGSLTIGDGLGGANADVVRFTANNQIWSTVPIAIAASGLLDLNGYSDTLGALTFTGGRATSGAGGLLYLAGDVTANTSADGPASLEGNVNVSAVRTFSIANSPFSPDLTLLAAVAGAGGITKTGSGALGLYASNAFSGTVTVGAGLAYVYDDAALGSTAGGTVVSNGGVLVLSSDTHVGAETLTLNGNGDGISGALASIAGANSWAGPITLASDATISVQSNRVLTLTGAVGGPGGFTKTQPGSILFQGASANSYLGTTRVNEGGLTLNKAGVETIPNGALIIGQDVSGAPAASVFESSSEQIGTIPVTINSSAGLELDDFRTDTIGDLRLNGGHVNIDFGTLTLEGNLTVANNPDRRAEIFGAVGLTTTRTFDIADTPFFPDLSLSGAVTGAGGFTKTGAGVLGLYQSGSFSGTATINAGQVQLYQSGALGATSGGTVVNSNAVLVLADELQVGAEPLTLNSTGAAGLGALHSISESNSWAGDITLARDSVITVLTNGCLNLVGALGGPGGFRKANPGTLILSGTNANTYAGTTYVDAGILECRKAADDGAIPGALVVGDGLGGANADILRTFGPGIGQINDVAAVTINASGRWELGTGEDIGALQGTGALDLQSPSGLGVGNGDSSSTFAGLISGVGPLGKKGAGTLTLTGNNTYTGTTYADDGLLLVNGSQPSSPIMVYSSGTLGGIGSVGTVTSSGGTIAPGLSPGTLTSSNVVLDSASDLIIELTGGGHDQLNASGTVALGNAALVVSATGLLPVEGETFVILNNAAAEAVTGTFAGLPEGALVSAGLRQFRITYAGGSGNDVALVATNTAALRPTLTIRPTATNTVIVSWPQSDLAWLLHATTNLAATPISWTELPPPYATNGAQLQFTEPAPLGNKFYRLHKP